MNPQVESFQRCKHAFHQCQERKVKSLSRVWLFVTPWTTRLLHPWDFPGKRTGVGCHFLLQQHWAWSQLALHLLSLVILHFYHLLPPLPPSFSNTFCLFTGYQPLDDSCCPALLYFPRHWIIRFKNVFFIFVFGFSVFSSVQSLCRVRLLRSHVSTPMPSEELTSPLSSQGTFISLIFFNFKTNGSRLFFNHSVISHFLRPHGL